MPFVVAGDHRIEYEWIGSQRSDAPVIVFLHEGLGSVAMWKDFPARLCAVIGCRGLVYSRYGYGRSNPLERPRAQRFMHDEATITLPQLLDQLEIHSPILFGHSDGGSIALLHAALADRPVRAAIVVAPHVFVEDLSITSIEAAKHAYEMTDLRARLARYHDDPDSAFRGWNDIWLHPDFRTWNIEDVLPRIRCPILAMQGVDDEYGTMEQIERIARGATHSGVALVRIPDCGHSPHRDQPQCVIDEVRDWLQTVAP
jgi:pimeloyl-ACP methyl ester carboxylesterase